MAFQKKADADKHIRQDISLPPDLLQRVIRYCQTEERSVSYVFQKAADEWLTARGF